MIAEAVTEDATIESVRQVIADVFATEKARMIVCPDCGSEFKTPLPDIKAQVDALISLLEQAEGKAESKPQEATSITIVRPPR
jgi:hypothetical protein